MAPWRGFFILFFLEVAKSSALQSRLHSELKLRLVGMHEALDGELCLRTRVHRPTFGFRQHRLQHLKLGFLLDESCLRGKIEKRTNWFTFRAVAS